MIPRFLDMFDMDFFLLALRYTLGEQDTLDQELPLCERRDVGIVIGGAFNSGLYATGPIPGAKYNYEDASEHELKKAYRIQTICESHGVPLIAAALQFPMLHPQVTSVIPGAQSARQVIQNVEYFQHEIPMDMWNELKHERLIRIDAPTSTNEPAIV